MTEGHQLGTEVREAVQRALGVLGHRLGQGEARYSVKEIKLLYGLLIFLKDCSEGGSEFEAVLGQLKGMIKEGR